ncbi:MAG: VOC family protein [Actinophytocola sp.]|uniref:VOC family protein n=1 Tax=Actinophytocola sp. TaxID=1872138 RepID=UPI003D6BE986
MHMKSATRAALGAISPLFVVSDLQQALAFYRERLGFEVTHQAPTPDPFFAIVARDGVQVLLKVVADDVGALPNPSRHPHARWDAYVHVSDPDALAAEFRDRGVTFSTPLADTDDGLRGFELTDHDGYVLFFGRPAGDAY